MLLKELQEGKRFMFADRGTPIAFFKTRGSYPATGTFIYEGVGESATPKLKHVETGTQLQAVPGTYFRSVLIILQ